MSMKLSSEKEHLVLDNQRLVHYLVKRFGVTPNSLEYEDIVSIGTIGLIKAAITFDLSKKNTFGTYASKCINNEILMHYRKANKYANDISIDTPIGNDGEGKELTLGETIEHSESNFVEKIVNKENLIQSVSIILNYLEGKTRLAILYKIGGLSKKAIAKKLNISRDYASRFVKKAINEIREVVDYRLQYNKVFHISIVGDEYRISFLSKDISKFNKNFQTLLENLTSTEKLPDFRVNCKRERIIVQVPAYMESFYFIAEIIQKIDDVDTIDTAKKTLVDGLNIEAILSNLEEMDTVAETDAKSTVKKGNQIKQIRDYMLSMNYFTVKNLRCHFPNMTSGTINNAVYLAKKKGMITAISRGLYRVEVIEP